MSGFMSILVILFLLAGVFTVVAFTWLWRALRWQVVEDDDLHETPSRGLVMGRPWLGFWLRKKPPLLTYRRDRRGRFRRYRR